MCASRWTRCTSPSGSVAALPKCNPVQSEPPPLQQSMIIQAVRGRITFTAAPIDAGSSGTRVPSEDAHHPSTRPTLPHSLASAAKRAAADHTSSARRRVDELLAGGASRTSSRTTTGPVARSGPGQCASSNACHRSGDHHRGTCGAMWSMWELREGASHGLLRPRGWLRRCMGRTRDQDGPPSAQGRQGDRCRGATYLRV